MTDQPEPTSDRRPVRRFITIRAVHSNEELDLEMPADRPVAELMPDLLKALGWPVPEGGDPQVYQLSTESGEALNGTETLDAAGIENSDVLWIGVAEGGTEGVQVPGATMESVGAVPTPFEAAPALRVEERGREDALTPPIPAVLRVESPSLVSKRGFVFELGAPPVLIGRKSQNSDPEVDLTEVDPEMASSRRHARILLQKGRYLLEALPTTNGTFHNGNQVKAGEIRPLQSGDRVLFGVDGVELVFLMGGEVVPASFFQPGHAS